MYTSARSALVCHGRLLRVESRILSHAACSSCGQSRGISCSGCSVEVAVEVVAPLGRSGRCSCSCSCSSGGSCTRTTWAGGEQQHIDRGISYSTSIGRSFALVARRGQYAR